MVYIYIYILWVSIVFSLTQIHKRVILLWNVPCTGSHICYSGGLDRLGDERGVNTEGHQWAGCSTERFVSHRAGQQQDTQWSHSFSPLTWSRGKVRLICSGTYHKINRVIPTYHHKNCCNFLLSMRYSSLKFKGKIKFICPMTQLHINPR